MRKPILFISLSVRNYLNVQVPVVHCLRGIAALAVSLGHLVRIPTKYFSDPVLRNIFSVGQYGVYMFFMISAVVIPLSMIRSNYSHKELGKFMLKRLIRLEPPYLVSIILAVFMIKVKVMLLPDFADTTPGARDLLLHIGYLVPFFKGEWASMVYWTLSVEFQYYLALAIMFPFAFNGIRSSRYAFYAIFLLIPFLYQHAHFLPLYGPLFLAGIVYTLWQSGKVELTEYAIVSLLCATACVWKLLPAACIAATLTLLIIHFFTAFSNRILHFLGEISYSYYLTHLVSGLTFVNLLSHHFPKWYQKIFVLTGGVLFAIGFAWIFYLLFERLSKKLASGVSYRNHEPSTVEVKP